jgi:hypothetical protein
VAVAASSVTSGRMARGGGVSHRPRRFDREEVEAFPPPFQGLDPVERRRCPAGRGIGAKEDEGGSRAPVEQRGHDRPMISAVARPP